MSYDRVEEGVLNWNICLVRVNVMKLELVSSCLFSKSDSGVQSSVGYRVTTCKLGY